MPFPGEMLEDDPWTPAVQRSVEAQSSAGQAVAPAMGPPGLGFGGMDAGAGLPAYLSNPSQFVPAPPAESELQRGELPGDHPFSGAGAPQGLQLSQTTPPPPTTPPVSQEIVDHTRAARIFQRTGLNLGVEQDDLIWKVACKTGTLALSPGPGQIDVEQPLELTDALFDDMVLSAQEKAFPYITVPETHANGSLENQGYVRKAEVLTRDELLADTRLPEKHRADVEADPETTRYLMAGIEFTEPETKGKAQRGSIPDTSIGVKFNYRNKRSGKLYKAAWEHLALTPVPWVDGLVPFGLSQTPSEQQVNDDADVYVDTLDASVSVRVKNDGGEYDWELEGLDPAQIREDAEEALGVLDDDSDQLDLPLGVCMQRFGAYWVIKSDYDKIAGIVSEDHEALDLAMDEVRKRYEKQRLNRNAAKPAPMSDSDKPLPPWDELDASVDGDTLIPKPSTGNLSAMSQTVEEILAAQQAEIEAANARTAALEQQLALSQGTINSQADQLHAENVAKKVADYKGRVSPAVLTRYQEIALAAKPSTATGGLQLSVTRTADTGEAETVEFSSAIEVADYLLSAASGPQGDAAVLLASVEDNLELATQNVHREKSAKEKVDEWEKSAHPERFNEDGTRKSSEVAA